MRDTRVADRTSSPTERHLGPDSKPKRYLKPGGRRLIDPFGAVPMSSGLGLRH